MSVETPISEGRQAGVTPRVASVARDLLDLVDLQVKMAAIDLKTTGERTRQATMFWAGAALMGSAALTMLLAGLGMFITEQFHLPVSLSLIVAAGLAAIISSASVWFAIRATHGIGATFARSSEEFTRNMQSLRRLFQINED